MLRTCSIMIVVAVVGLWSSPIFADLPWEVWEDSESTSVCGIVNAENVELVVQRSDEMLIIVTGQDITLTNTFVRENGDVLVDGVVTGGLTFALDEDGYRTLWWVADETGTVMSVDSITLNATPSDFAPSDFSDVPCDACPFWDETLPLNITTEPQDTTACEGDKVTLFVDADDCQLEGYQWYKNGVAIQDENDSTLVFVSADAFDTASYHVVLASTDGPELASDLARLVVNECTSQPSLFCGNGLATISGLIFASLLLMRFTHRRAD